MPDPDYTPTAEMVDAAGTVYKRTDSGNKARMSGVYPSDYLADLYAALHAARKVDPLVGEVERLRDRVQWAERIMRRIKPNAFRLGALSAQDVDNFLAALNQEETPLAEPLERIPSHTSPSTDGFTYVQIDRLPYKVAVRSYTGVEVRKFAHPPIAADRDLWLLQIPGEPDRLIRDDDSVQIGPHSGTRFWTHPTHINGG